MDIVDELVNTFFRLDAELDKVKAEYRAAHVFDETPDDFVKRIGNRNNPMSDADRERLNNCWLEGWAVFIHCDGRPI